MEGNVRWKIKVLEMSLTKEGIVLGGVEQSFDYRRIAGKNFGAVYFPFFFFRA